MAGIAGHNLDAITQPACAAPGKVDSNEIYGKWALVLTCILAYSLLELETLAGVPIFVKSRTSFPLYQVREGTSLCTTSRSDRAGGFGDDTESWI